MGTLFHGHVKGGGSFLRPPWGLLVLAGVFLVSAAPWVAADYFLRPPYTAGLPLLYRVPFCTSYLASFALFLLLMSVDGVLCRAWRRWARCSNKYREWAFLLGVVGVLIFVYLALGSSPNSSTGTVEAVVGSLLVASGAVPALYLLRMLEPGGAAGGGRGDAGGGYPAGRGGQEGGRGDAGGISEGGSGRGDSG